MRWSIFSTLAIVLALGVQAAPQGQNTANVQTTDESEYIAQLYTTEENLEAAKAPKNVYLNVSQLTQNACARYCLFHSYNKWEPENHHVKRYCHKPSLFSRRYFWTVKSLKCIKKDCSARDRLQFQQDYAWFQKAACH